VKILYLHPPVEILSAYGLTSIKRASLVRNKSYNFKITSAVSSFFLVNPTLVITSKASSLDIPNKNKYIIYQRS